MEKINELSLKLKNGVIENLLNSPRDIDVKYMFCGNDSYTRRELADEIKKETEFGLDMLISAMSSSIDIVARNSLNDKNK